MNPRKLLTVLLLVITLAVGVGAASADPVTLICKINDFTRVEDGPTTIYLDEARGTVTVHAGPWHLSPSYGVGNIPADSYGPVPATFTAETISFSVGAISGTINRLTGDANINGRYTCEPSKAKF